MKPMESKHPPRAWVKGHFPHLSNELLSYRAWATNFPEEGAIEYCAVSEANAIAEEREARARREAFEEAADYLYTTNSSDEQHEHIEQMARELRLIGAVPKAQPAPSPPTEAAVPGREKCSIRYRCRGIPERQIQFNFDGERITCVGSNGLVGKGNSPIEEIYSLADNLGIASRELLADFVRRHESELLKQVRQARAEAFKEAAEMCSGARDKFVMRDWCLKRAEQAREEGK